VSVSIRTRQPGLRWIALAAALLAGGCERTEHVTQPPRHIGEYARSRPNARTGYPDRIVRMHSLQRALDPDVSEDDRLLALLLLEHVGTDDPDVGACLLRLAAEDDAPPRLRALAARLVRQGAHPRDLTVASAGGPGAAGAAE